MTERQGSSTDASRPRLTFLAWTPIQGRSAEIAAALGGEAHCVYDARLVRRALVPLRYALSTVETLRYLRRRRPRAIVVTNPPLLPGYLAWAWARRARIPVVLDTHPGGFGAQGDRVSGRLQAAHRWLARRVRASMVTDELWVDRLGSWGATGVVVHEAPPLWSVGPAAPLRPRPRVLFVGTFGGDEPVEVVFGAARHCPELDVWVTGDPRRCPPELLEDLAPNVTLTGFLGPDDYAKAVGEADAVLTLSSEPTSVMRAAYEAVYAERPLVVSDWPGLRSLFPHAVAVPNTATGVAQGLRQAVSDHERLVASAHAAHRRQDERWEQQRRRLAAVLGLDRDPSAPPAGDDRPAPADQRLVVAGIPVSLTDWHGVESWARRCIERGEAATLCTVAPFQVHLARTDPDYRRCLERASVVLVDGNGVRLLLATAGVPPGPRLTGRELAQLVHAGTLLADTRVAVVGGAQATHDRLRLAHPSWLLLGGRFSDRPRAGDDQVVETARRLASFDAQLVLVALGSPKMELWADALARHHPAVYASVGGAVDTAAGVRRPPPTMVSRLGVEFAWRAAQDPSLLPRLAKGLSAMPSSVARALRENVARRRT